MRVVVVGASGNVGTSTLAALGDAPAVEEIVALARRRPQLELPKARCAEADVTRDDLVERFRGAACVIHLAWLIQPSRVTEVTTKTTVDGSRRVFAADAEAKVPALDYALS